MNVFKIFLLIMINIINLNYVNATEVINVGEFSKGIFNDWQEKEFKGTTQYQLENQDGMQILAATVSSGASGLFKKIKIDLNQTPYINWQWKVNQAWPNLNEKTKEGDDYPARLYVVVERGFLGISSKTVNYVWSSQQPVNNMWVNAFTSQAVLIAVESGSENVKQWRNYKRNVKEDLKQAFGEEFNQIQVVALMSDGDNSKQSGQAYFGDIWFTSE
ncbi:MAG: DUF3047 domain-containing protein [Vibrio sp.]